MLTRRTSRSASLVSAVVSCLVVAGCADVVAPSEDEVVSSGSTDEGPSLGPPRAPTLLLAAEDDPRVVATQTGSAPVEVSVTSLDDGVITAAPGFDSVTAFRFPAFAPAGTYARAALVVRNLAGSDDPLSPALKDFSFGADVAMDTTSVGRAFDNGNNVIQRGLSSDPVMFKLDIDGDLRPRCTVHGVAGKLIVAARDPLNTGTWYSVRCDRAGVRLTIRVGEYLPSGQVYGLEQREVIGPIGGVEFPARSQPVAIGGKITKDGSVVRSSTDQFNGLLARPFLAISP